MSLNKWVVWKEFTENVYFYFDTIHPDYKGKYAKLFNMLIEEQGIERVHDLLCFVVDVDIWSKLRSKYKITGPPIFNVLWGFRFSLLQDMDNYNAKKTEKEKSNRDIKSNKKNLFIKK